MMHQKFGMRRRVVYMRRQQMVLFGSGALLLSIITLSATVLLTDKEAEAHVKVVSRENFDDILSRVKIFVPTGEIDAGTKITRGMLREQETLRSELPAGALRVEDLNRDFYAKAKLDPGKAITRELLSETPLFGNIADLIKPGYRAATLEVDATSGVEGWATAGAHVDVVVTYQDPEDGKKKSQIAIENAVVLSYNRSTERGKENDAGKGGTQTATVTVSVPVMDAVRIHTARAMGRISLVLRSIDDTKGIGPTVVTPEDFRTGPKPKKPAELASRGTVRFTGADGSERELELSGGNSWTELTTQ